MPRAKRKPDEIEAVKEEMLDLAFEMIVSDGYDGFTMRKLGAGLGVTPKTIYNYFTNKDEIYLLLLQRGFEKLNAWFDKSVRGKTTPRETLRALIAAYLDFAFDNPNLYSLMFTWNVPKYNDFIDTPMEPAARAELEEALKVPALFEKVIRSWENNGFRVTESQARRMVIFHWCEAHGYLAGCLNNLLDYLHDKPASLKDTIARRILRNFERDLEDLHAPPLKPVG